MPRAPRVLRFVVVMATTAAMGLAACGDGGSSADQQSGSTTASATQTPVAPSSRACTTPPPAPSSVPTFAGPPDPKAAAGTAWVATITTNCGTITAELFGAKAPQTVASFNHLAEAGYWKDSPCHRLTTRGLYVLQCGDPTGTGQGDPGYGFGIENAPASGDYPPGTLAMARTADPNSNGGQFFIVYKDTQLPTAGGGYSIFGRVTDGLDIVTKIAAAGVAGGMPDGRPAQPISILTVAVTEKKA